MFAVFLIIFHILFSVLIFYVKGLSSKIDELPEKIAVALLNVKSERIQSQLDELNNKVKNLQDVRQEKVEKSP